MAPKRQGKEEAPEIDPLDPIMCSPSNEQIKIEQKTCLLVVHDNKIPGTSLYHGTLSTGPCSALLKPTDEAHTIYEVLSKCDHPNILKPLGVWDAPNDKTKAYLVFEEVHAALLSKEKEFMFSMEGSMIHGFSGNGFESFRSIFSAVDYVNNIYQKDIGSSTSEGSLPLLPLKLNNSSIFYKLRSSTEAHDEIQALVGDFLSNYPTQLLKTKNIQVATVEHIKQFNWKKAGEYLSSFCGHEDNVNLEMKVLATFLKSETVSYEDLLWQPGIWEANIKVEFIREVFWIIDRQRDKNKTCTLASTEKGQVLNNIKHPLKVVSCLQKFTDSKLTETTLLDSVVLLRHHILGHHDESYKFYKGPKGEIGPDKVSIERFLQKSSPEYMINLSKEIRCLKWITQSPLLRDENNYMAMFYEMEKKKISEQS